MDYQGVRQLLDDRLFYYVDFLLAILACEVADYFSFDEVFQAFGYVVLRLDFNRQRIKLLHILLPIPTLLTLQHHRRLPLKHILTQIPLPPTPLQLLLQPIVRFV